MPFVRREPARSDLEIAQLKRGGFACRAEEHEPLDAPPPRRSIAGAPVRLCGHAAPAKPPVIESSNPGLVRGAPRRTAPLVAAGAARGAGGLRLHGVTSTLSAGPAARTRS
jgi:hypothetical protein